MSTLSTAATHIAATRAATQTTPAVAHALRGTFWLQNHAIGSVRTGQLQRLPKDFSHTLAALGWQLVPIAPEHAHGHELRTHPDADCTQIGWQLRPITAPIAQSKTQSPSNAKTTWTRGCPTSSFAQPTQALDALAQALREVGACMAWRDEAIGVHAWEGRDFAPTPVASIERAAVRALGIATQAVHLVGYVGELPNNTEFPLNINKSTLSAYKNIQIWLQQRSLNKSTHPGQWDTLMGGMCAADDAQALVTHAADAQAFALALRPYLGSLARETWEEAGLRLDQLQALRHGGHIDIACAAGAHEPSQATACGQCPPAQDIGWVRERIHWAAAQLPTHISPQNRDGEVAQFALLSVDEVLQRIARSQCTPEATLVLAAFLGVLL